MQDDDRKRQIDLQPSEWFRKGARWQPKIGNELRPGEKPHIWQEWERDMDKQRYADESFIGRGWPIFAVIFLIGFVELLFRIDGGPGWLVSLKNLF